MNVGSECYLWYWQRLIVHQKVVRFVPLCSLEQEDIYMYTVTQHMSMLVMCDNMKIDKILHTGGHLGR